MAGGRFCPGPVNVAIVGPWGIGKSSLVRYLTRLASEAGNVASAPG